MSSSPEEGAHYKEKRTKVNRRFKAEEDELLRELVMKYGENDWKRISKLMKNRSVRQCKDRWLQYLSPAANRTPWTVSEETELLSLVKKFGKDWKIIAYSFPGRPISQLRNKYKTVEGRYLNKPIKEKATNVKVDLPKKVIKAENTNNSDLIVKETNEDRNIFDIFQDPFFDFNGDALEDLSFSNCWFE